MSDGIEVVVGLFVVLSIVVVVALTGVMIFYDIGLDSGNGEQIGYISEVEQNGWLWRPPEVRLISSEPTYSSSDTVWYYGVPSKEMTDLARKYLKTHEKVIVSYEVRQVASRWDYSTRVIITDIKPA